MFTAIRVLVGVACTFDLKLTWRQARAISTVASLEALHVYVGLSCTMVEWQKGLEQKGLYYEGIVNGSRLDSVLELHRRSTVSTFGTRRSSRVSVGAQTEKRTNNENVRVY